MKEKNLLMYQRSDWKHNKIFFKSQLVDGFNEMTLIVEITGIQ